jgi:hypothetical protein
MERHVTPPADGSAPPTIPDSPIWHLIFLGLIVWQGWMTLTLFGADHPWERLRNDQPIISGQHPLHLYHGILGSESLRERGRLCCYDPAFQAGYPKTPIFDAGSRPAELFLTAGHALTRHRSDEQHEEKSSESVTLEGPAAYKIGLAICCCLAPILLMLASRGFGLSRGLSCAATVLGQMVWWSTPGRALLEAGDLHLLMGALIGLVSIAWLVRFDQAPDLRSWLVLLFAGCLGWFADPVFFVLLLPLGLIYYLSVGVRHRLGWHAALIATLLGALASNGFWLVDWASNWWIRLPMHPLEFDGFPQQLWQRLWSAGLWGQRPDRSLAIALLIGGALGVWLLNESKQRAAARLVGLGAAGCLALVMGGLIWQPLSRLGTERLLVPALWFAVLPTVHAAGMAIRFAERLAGNPARGAVVGCWLVVVLMVGVRNYLSPLAARCVRSSPFIIGLSQEQQAVIETLRARTHHHARILWEDHHEPPDGSRWTALLPLLTDRFFMGGLDPDCGIEHSFAGLVEQTLAGRPIREWTNAELDEFCRKYAIAWVVCRSPASVERFRKWDGTIAVTPLADEKEGWLITLKPRSFILKGQGRIIAADSRRITLADLVPEDGRVLLSLHYQAGIQASPSRVQVEREIDPYDPIPFIRLRLPGPVARVSLTWEEQ